SATGARCIADCSLSNANERSRGSIDSYGFGLVLGEQLRGSRRSDSGVGDARRVRRSFAGDTDTRAVRTRGCGRGAWQPPPRLRHQVLVQLLAGGQAGEHDLDVLDIPRLYRQLGTAGPFCRRKDWTLGRE